MLLPVLAAILTAVVTPASARAYNEPRLVDAAGSGDAAAVQGFLSRGADVDSRDSRGRTALIVAAGAGHVYIMEKLIGAGADVGAWDCSGKTALVYAADNNQTYAGQILLAAGAGSPTVRMGNGSTAQPAGVTPGDAGAVDSSGGLAASVGYAQGPPGGGSGSAGMAASGAGPATPADPADATPGQDIEYFKETGMKAVRILVLAAIGLLCAWAVFRKVMPGK